MAEKTKNNELNEVNEMTKEEIIEKKKAARAKMDRGLNKIFRGKKKIAIITIIILAFPSLGLVFPSGIFGVLFSAGLVYGYYRGLKMVGKGISKYFRGKKKKRKYKKKLQKLKDKNKEIPANQREQELEQEKTYKNNNAKTNEKELKQDQEKVKARK